VPQVDSAGIADAAARGDTAACIELCRNLSEAERRDLSKAAIARYQALREERAQNLSASRQELRDRQRAALAVLYASAGFKEIKRLDNTWLEPPYEVLVSRRPAWLEQWAEWTLHDGARRSSRWLLVRRLIQDQILPRPETDDYYVGLLRHHDARQCIDRDPDLLQHELWKLFEVEGHSDASFAQHDKYTHEKNQWAPFLVELAESGRIERKRLLAASVGALLRGFKAFQSAWFSTLHETLKPSIEERAELARDYLQLLASAVPPNVSFALRAIQQLESAGCLDAEEFLQAVPAALYNPSAGTAETALKVLESIVKRQPELRERAAELAASALEHASPAVQKKALALVQAWSDADALPARLADAARVIAPSLRKLLPAAPAAAKAAAKSAAKSPAPASDPRLVSIPEVWLRLAGIEADGSLVSPHLDSPDIPRLHRGNAIGPIASIEELVPILLRVLETEEPIDDVERALDAISRLCAQRPAAFERLTSPLRKRAQTIAKRWMRSPASLLARLSLAWIDKADPAIRLDGETAESFLAKRVNSVAARMREGIAQPLLSAPTHAGGWIDPQLLKQRLAASAQPHDPLDLELAQLRAGGEYPVWLKKPLHEIHMIRWAATILPGQREEWFNTGARVLELNLDWWQALWGNKTYLESLFDPDTPLGDAGLRMLVAGLAAKENGEGTLAADALNVLIEDGRLEAARLARALRDKMPTEPVPAKEVTVSRLAISKRLAKASQSRGYKMPRVAKRLAQASRTSALHGITIQQTLDLLLAGGDSKPFRQLYDDLTAEYPGRDSELKAGQLRIRLDRAARWAAIET
jgi:hypothetical protein